jgi:YHS domain-containing protein
MNRVPILLLVAAASACACGSKEAPFIDQKTPPEENKPRLDSTIRQEVQCPVCGLKFDKRETAAKYRYEGTEYYFLLKDHFLAFKADPENYVKLTKGLDITNNLGENTPVEESPREAQKDVEHSENQK